MPPLSDGARTITFRSCYRDISHMFKLSMHAEREWTHHERGVDDAKVDDEGEDVVDRHARASKVSSELAALLPVSVRRSTERRTAGTVPSAECANAQRRIPKPKMKTKVKLG